MKGKPCQNQELFTFKKSYQSVNIQNELAFAIWNYKLKVMAKRKVQSQIGNMIPHD